MQQPRCLTVRASIIWPTVIDGLHHYLEVVAPAANADSAHEAERTGLC